MPTMEGKGTLYARAYTKSGSIEKYEGGLYDRDPYSGNEDYYIISQPDVNGNYSVTTTLVPMTVTTIYHGKECTFTFTANTGYMTITITVRTNYGPGTTTSNYVDYLYINSSKSYIGSYSIVIYLNGTGGNFNLNFSPSVNGANELVVTNRNNVSINSVTLNGNDLKSGYYMKPSTQYANTFDNIYISANGW